LGKSRLRFKDSSLGGSRAGSGEHGSSRPSFAKNDCDSGLAESGTLLTQARADDAMDFVLG
jgi:hypothetical protein